MMITITNWSDGTAIYSGEALDLRDAVQRAVKNRVSLAQAELLFTDLSGVDLSGVDLRGANLFGSDLHNAGLRGANLGGADLNSADLHGADLREANLSGTYLCGARLSRANFCWANLYEAVLYWADLRHADFRGANLCCADLRETDLSGAILACTDLRRTDLRGARGAERGRDGQVEGYGGMSNTARVTIISMRPRNRVWIGLSINGKPAGVMMDREEYLKRNIRLGDMVELDESNGIKIRSVRHQQHPLEAEPCAS